MYDLSDFEDFKRLRDKVRNTHKWVIVDPIREYDINGKFIKLWPNISNLSKSENLNYYRLRTHLKEGKPLVLDNRIYLKDNDSIKDRLIQLQMLSEKKDLIEYANKAQQVHVYHSDGTFINTFNNIREARKYTKVDSTCINNSIRGKALITKGYIFLTPFESIEERLEKIKNRKTWKTNF